MSKKPKEVKVNLEPLLQDALEFVLDERGYSTVAEYIRDKIRTDADKLNYPWQAEHPHGGEKIEEVSR